MKKIPTRRLTPILGLAVFLAMAPSQWARAEISGIRGAIHYDELKRTVSNAKLSFDDVAFAAFVCGSGQVASAATGVVEALEFLPPIYVGPLSAATEGGKAVGAVAEVSKGFGELKYSFDVTAPEVPAYLAQATAQVVGYLGIPIFGFYKMSADPMHQAARRREFKSANPAWIAPAWIGGGAGALLVDAAAAVGDYLWDGKLDQPTGRATEHAFWISNGIRARSYEMRKSCAAITKLYRAGRAEFARLQAGVPATVPDARSSTAALDSKPGSDGAGAPFAEKMAHRSAEASVAR